MTLLGRSLPIGPGHFAALHGLLVLALLPIALALHGRKVRRGSSSGELMAWGYVATAAAFAVMALAGLAGGDHGRVGAAWLVVCYVFLSLAEVLLAPLGVSLATRLAPPGKTAWAVSLWFAGSAQPWPGGASGSGLGSLAASPLLCGVGAAVAGGGWLVPAAPLAHELAKRDPKRCGLSSETRGPRCAQTWDQHRLLRMWGG